MHLQENNQRWGGVVPLDVNRSHPEVDDFPITACSEIFIPLIPQLFFFTSEFVNHINGKRGQFT